MSNADRPETGTVGWIDLTVEDAEAVRDFYAAVTGWQPEPVSMGDYDDFTMTTPASGSPCAGVCHARGSNAGLPSQWLIYINVDHLDESLATCTELGGEVIAGPKVMSGHGRFAVIQDPAGAVVALFEPSA